MIEVVKYRDLLTVSSVPRFVPGLEVLTIEIKGEDFSNVEKVLINEILAPQFIVTNKNTMWVELPEGARESIRTIEAISSKFTKNNVFSKVAYQFGTKTKSVSGILRLTQLFVKWLLQSPGSDIFNPERGGGLQELAGRISTSKKMEAVMSAVTQSVSSTSSQIRATQSNLPGLSLDERLLSATVADIRVYEAQMEASVRIDLRSMSGKDALASLVV